MSANSGWILKTLSSKSFIRRSFQSLMSPSTMLSHRSTGCLGTMRENASRVLTANVGFIIDIQ